MAKTERSIQEFNEMYLHQRERLNALAADYDSGRNSAAIDLAVVISVFVRSHGKNKSVLDQLGIAERVRFVSTTSRFDKKNLAPTLALVGMSTTPGNHWHYTPTLDSYPERRHDVGLWTWWDREIIYARGPKGPTINRKQLIMSIRDQDSGAHLDESLSDEAYVEMSRNGPWRLGVGADAKAMKFLHFASVRQVAHEMKLTLDRVGL